MTSNMEQQIRASVLTRLDVWGSACIGYKHSHAVDGLFITQGYLELQDPSPTEIDEDKLFVLALTLTYWFWLDDRSDDHLDAPAVDWAALLLHLSSEDYEVPSALPQSIEVTATRRLCDEVRRISRSDEDYRWWLESAKLTIRNLVVEEKAAQTRMMLAYSDYVEVGLWTSAVPNLLATASLLYSFGIASSRREANVAIIERQLSIVARLENDLFGVEKERREHSVANAVLIIETYAGQDEARRFVTCEKDCHERRLREAMMRIGQQCPVAMFAASMLRSHRRYYIARPLRVDQN